MNHSLKIIFNKKEQWQIEKEDYALLGSSAGGHLAGLFSSTKFSEERYHLARPTTVILLYPVISLCKAITHEGTSRQFSKKTSASGWLIKAIAFWASNRKDN